MIGVGAKSDSEWYHYYLVIYTLPGTLIIFTTVISGIYFYLKSPVKLELKKNYMNLKVYIYDVMRELNLPLLIFFSLSNTINEL